MKSYGTMEGVYINGAPQGITFHETDNFTLYPASILTVNKNRFTKHYFIGSQRIASRIGTGTFNNVYGVNGSYVTAGQQDYAEHMNQIQSQKEAYYKELGIAPGVPTEKGAYGDPENTGVGYNTIITNLGDHSVPQGWVQTPKHNTTEGSTPGTPISWNEPSNPDDPQAGYGYIANDTTTEETFFFHSDHLGSTSYITDDKGNITQYDAYLPYGELLVDEHSSTEEMPYKFNGKEMDEETGLYYYGARYMNPVVGLWYGVDKLTEKYPTIGVYTYGAANPIKITDPDGYHVEVTPSLHGKYSVVGGFADNDLNIYVHYGTKNQKVIGRMLTKYSFMDERGNAVKNAVIDLSDKSGEKFLSNFMKDTPNLMVYMPNAVGGEKYDFKRAGTKIGDALYNNSSYHNRGMRVRLGGKTYIASARDIGNFAAGYVAGKNDLSWDAARAAFDGLETAQHAVRGKLGIYREGKPTQYAERLGYNIGTHTETAKALRNLRLHRSQYNTTRFSW